MAALKTLLFLPGYLGDGFGHIAACLALAEEWRRRGGRAGFVLGGPHAARVRQAGFDVYLLRALPSHAGRAPTPAYTLVNDLNYLAVRDGLDHPLRVAAALWEARRAARAIRADAVVGDGSLLTALLGAQTGLPVIQIAKSTFHPQGAPLGAWEAPPGGQILPDVSPVFAPLLRRAGLEYDSVADLIRGDLYLLRASPALDPLLPLPAQTFYTGALTRAAAPVPSTPPPAWLDTSRPLVYVTVGGASQSGVSPEFFGLMARALGGRPWQVIVSTGGRSDLSGAPPENLHVEKWVNPSEILPFCAAVVHHGGYTRMEALQHGLPAVVIPFQTEQEYYGRILQQQGAAALLAYSDEPYTRYVVRWRGGRLLAGQSFSVHVRQRATLQPERLRRAVERALDDAAMRQAAQRLRDELCSYGGASQAAGLIAQELHCE